MRALHKHAAGVTLIGLQIALTLAIVCNAMFIIVQRIERLDRATGVEEKDLFLVSQQWVGAFSDDNAVGLEKLDTMKREDIATLRALPDVASVSSINSLPLLNSSWNGSVNTKPDTREGAAHTTFYSGDEQMFGTLGLHLLQGRAFSANDIVYQGLQDNHYPPVALVTRHLARLLFPNRSALGQTVFFHTDSRPVTIVGVIDRLQSPSTESWGSPFAWNATLLPVRVDANFSRYAVHAQPGRMEAAMREVAPALYHLNPMRVLDDRSVRSFADIRHEAYEADRGMAVLMTAIPLILLGVTAAGIVGLTSFWVGQRRRQIGIRRALGARKADILHDLQFENALISAGGATLGVVLAVGLNLWLITRYEMNRLPLSYRAVSVAVMFVLGQAATFVPAWRASHVQPIEATRV